MQTSMTEIIMAEYNVMVIMADIISPKTETVVSITKENRKENHR